ncbi:hypothetical protein dsx2_1025 [Desulfovibrio sp. X2]|uniref:ATP-binding protein n=1 Tax=Desulfovibrio sp. X2 TaxID=941449 RepID=UPI000358810A|nr:ATP-binding protein [Desulfovibrio sp. X2]EPR37082.1 hypothetical protein dsx2_1025 [Desulfovibrio sp. X2]
MLKKLILENFMAHGRTEIELGEGLTVLSGPNNAGKSAVVEALRCLATNPTPRHYIRHGAKEARVTAVLEDDVRLTWVRREKYALYEIVRPGQEEPETFAKLGKSGVPEEVAALLRLEPVEVEGPERFIDVHIGNQREPIFLLNKSPSVLASLLASSSEAAHLLAMQQALAARVRESKTREKSVLSRMAGLDAGLAAFTPLPELALRVEEAEAMHRALSVRLSAVPGLARLCASLRGLAARRGEGQGRQKALAGLEAPPAPAQVRPLAALVAARLRLDAARGEARERSGALAGLLRPPELSDTAGVRRALAELARLRGARGKAAVRSRELAELAAPPVLADAAGAARSGAELRRLAARRARLAARMEALAGLGEPPAPAVLAPLAERAAGLSRARAAVARAAAACQRAAAAEKACEARVREALATAGDCPLCGHRLDAATFLGRFGEVSGPAGKNGGGER